MKKLSESLVVLLASRNRLERQRSAFVKMASTCGGVNKDVIVKHYGKIIETISLLDHIIGNYKLALSSLQVVVSEVPQVIYKPVISSIRYRIRYNNSAYCMGYFDTAEEAYEHARVKRNNGDENDAYWNNYTHTVEKITVEDIYVITPDEKVDASPEIAAAVLAREIRYGGTGR